jgi:hypothetical protein
MSRQMLILVGILGVTFASGIGVGLFLGRTPDNSGSAAKISGGTTSSGFFTDADAEERVKDNTVLNNRIIELEKELAEQKQDQHAVLTDRLAFLKKYHDQIRISAFSGSNPIKITPEMVEILGLSKEEQQTIEQHLIEASKEMKQIQDTNTVMVKQTANSISFETPVDPQGKPIEETLNSTLASDIGQDRADFLMTSAGSYYSDPFSGFAEQKIGMEISWTQQNGAPLYTWKETGYRPDGTASGWSSSTGSSVPDQYQEFIQSAKP